MTKTAFTVSVIMLGAICHPAQSQEQGLYFVDHAKMADVYHVGLPCLDGADDGYKLVVDTTVPHLFDEGYVHATLRYTIADMRGWRFSNYCRTAVATPGVAIYRSGGQEFARAEFEYRGSFVEDLRVTRLANPEREDLAARIADIVLQGGGSWLRGGERWLRPSADDGYDARQAISELEALLHVAEPAYFGQIYYLKGRIQGIQDTMELRAHGVSGGDTEEFWAERSNADGERRSLSLLRKAAELGHLGAALRLHDRSGLVLHLGRYIGQDPQYPPDEIGTRRLLKNYGFIFDMARNWNIGGLLSKVEGLAQMGLTVGDQGVFEDRALPPSAMMIEAELNKNLGHTLAMQDGVLSDTFGIANQEFYDCDGTWCRIGGGFLGRARMSVRGVPDCEEVVSARTVCSFTLGIIFDTGEQYESPPFQRDPVVDFMQELFDTVSLSEDWPTVQAKIIRTDTGWSIDELARLGQR